MKIRILVLLIFFTILACKTSYKPIFHTLSDFDITSGNEFVDKIKYLGALQKISIVDRNIKKNEFRVNNVNVFNDTLQIDKPNTISYIKYAESIDIDSEQLHKVLKDFENMNVSEFIRKANFYLFPVEKYALAKQNGYLYSINDSIKVNDTLDVNEVYGEKIIVRKHIASNWFEYESQK